MRRGLLVLCTALAGACSVVNAGDFSDDRGCTLELKARAFSPHVADTLTVFLTRADVNGVDRRIEAIAIFDPLGAPNLDLRMPNAVRPRTSATQGLAAIEFFADFDATPGFSPGDHSWVLEDACASGPEDFPHVGDFIDVRVPAGEGVSVAVRLCGLPPGLANASGELRVSRRLPTEDPNDAENEVVDQAIGFYRVDDVSRRREGFFLRGVANADQDLVVDVVFDLNRNGIYEPPRDEAFSFIHDSTAPRFCSELPLMRTGCPDLTEMLSERVPVCLTDTRDMIVVVAPPVMEENRAPTLRDPSWYSISR